MGTILISIVGALVVSVVINLVINSKRGEEGDAIAAQVTNRLKYKMDDIKKRISVLESKDDVLTDSELDTVKEHIGLNFRQYLLDIIQVPPINPTPTPPELYPEMKDPEMEEVYDDPSDEGPSKVGKEAE